MSPEQIRVIERLRDAAREHGEVFDLLQTLKISILIDDFGNKVLTAEGADLEYLKAALIAADFAQYDASDEAI